MKTIIEFTDGTIEELPGAPSIDPEERTVFLVGSDNEVITDDVSLDSIKRITFEVNNDSISVDGYRLMGFSREEREKS